MSGLNNICVFYRDIKHLRIEVTSGSVNVIMPGRFLLKVEDIIAGHENWIKEKMRKREEIIRYFIKNFQGCS